jgi:hypothetical protein
MLAPSYAATAMLAIRESTDAVEHERCRESAGIVEKQNGGRG